MTLTDTDSDLLAAAATAAAEQIADGLGLAVAVGTVHDGTDPHAPLVPGAGSQAVAAGLRAAANADQAITGWLVLALAAEVVDSIEPDEDGNPVDLVEVARPGLEQGVAALEPAFGPQLMDDPETTDAESLLTATVAERAPHQLLAIVPLVAAGQHIGTVAVAVDRAEPAPAELPLLGPPGRGEVLPARSLSSLNDVEMSVTVELGRTRLAVRDLLELHPGAVVQLDRPATSPVDIFVNGTLIAKGEVVVVDDDFGVRITDLVDRD